MTALPDGRRGQALAVGLTVLVAVLAWYGGVAPVLAWYGDREDRLAERQVLAARMSGIAGLVPALQRQLQQADAAGTSPGAKPVGAVLEGGTDAIAGAALQGAVGDMANAAGASVTSAELLAAQPVGAYRRISLHVTASAPWPRVVTLLGAVAQATPRMLVDDLSLRQPTVLGQASSHPVDASFTVIAFRAVAPAAPPAAAR